MRRHLAALSAVTALTMAGCGSSDTPSPTNDASPASATTTSDTTTSETGGAATPGEDTGAVADQLQKAIPDISDRVEITEDNDPNNLIGRPGQYDQAILLVDKRLGCTDPTYNDFGIDCGAKLERWPTEADAKARMDDIQQKLKSYGLGAEYDYVVGRTLVRVAGALKPSQAAAYEDALP